MATPRIAKLYLNLSGKGADDVEVSIQTKPDDPRVSMSRAQILGVACLLESQLAFLPSDFKNKVIEMVALIVQAEKELVGFPRQDESSESSGYMPGIAAYTVDLYDAPRGPVAAVDTYFWRPFDRNAATSLLLMNCVRQTIQLPERQEVVRLLVLLEIGVRMWRQKKPTRMLYLTGASVYNRPNWAAFPSVMDQIGWAKYQRYFPGSFEEFLKMK